jgi:hypothetical protein
MTNPVNKKVELGELAAIIAADPNRKNASIGRHFGVTSECIRRHRYRIVQAPRIRELQALAHTLHAEHVREASLFNEQKRAAARADSNRRR